MSDVQKYKLAMLLTLWLGVTTLAQAHCTEFTSPEELHRHIDEHATDIELLVKDNSTHSDTLAAKHQELSHHLSHYHSLPQSVDVSSSCAKDFSRAADKPDGGASQAFPRLLPASIAGSRA